MTATLAVGDSELHREVLDELRWEPSVNAAHVGAAVQNGIVTLTGQPGQGGDAPSQRQEASRQQNENYLLGERRVQRFVRSFALPPNVDEQDVHAKLADGVLRITLRKREDTKPRRVQVS